MTSIISSGPCTWTLKVQENHLQSRANSKVLCSQLFFPSGASFYDPGEYHTVRGCHGRFRHLRPLFSSTLNDGVDPDDSEEGNCEEESVQNGSEGVNNELFRNDLERIVGRDDSTFSGIDLATLIRKKYGRSYDVLLIKKEFMGRNLLALNVMWKYREQRSFPLTEEEYLLRLDDVANTLKCWGAVSHIRTSLARLKERPRIGKAVSIFIDMDESGGRANEWIYK